MEVGVVCFTTFIVPNQQQKRKFASFFRNNSAVLKKHRIRMINIPKPALKKIQY